MSVSRKHPLFGTSLTDIKDGPVLNPLDILIMRNNDGLELDLNPILESKDGDFHLLFNIATGQTGGMNPDDRNSNIQFIQAGEAATVPRVSELIIITKNSPWCTIVTNKNGVSMQDVSTKLWKECVFLSAL